MLSVSALCASYGAIRAVNDLSFEVGANSMVAILGANGAGKSTTLRSIAGLHRPVRGSIKLGGEEISTLPVHRVVRRGLALVPEGRHDRRAAHRRGEPASSAATPGAATSAT